MKKIDLRLTEALMTVGLLLGAGCVPSVHPLYTEGDLAFNPDLLGTWAIDDGTWTFTAANDNAYGLTMVDKQGKTGDFTVYLVKVGDDLVLDLQPQEKDWGECDWYALHYFPCHTFWRLWPVESGYQVKCLDYQAVDKLLAEHPDAVRHERRRGKSDELILTAPPKELQAFLLAHADRIWIEDPETLVRKPEAAAPSPANSPPTPN